jgi:hypothetical protein
MLQKVKLLTFSCPTIFLAPWTQHQHLFSIHFVPEKGHVKCCCFLIPPPPNFPLPHMGSFITTFYSPLKGQHSSHCSPIGSIRAQSSHSLYLFRFSHTQLILLPWRWRQQISTNYRYRPTRLHSVTTRKTVVVTVMLALSNIKTSQRGKPLEHLHLLAFRTSFTCCLI